MIRSLIRRRQKGPGDAEAVGNQDESGGLHSQDTTEHAAQRHTQAKALRVPQAKDVAEFHALCLVTMAKKQNGYLKRATKTAR